MHFHISFTICFFQNKSYYSFNYFIYYCVFMILSRMCLWVGGKSTVYVWKPDDNI